MITAIDSEELDIEIGKIALIDADTIAYTAALATEEEEMILDKDFYSEEEWQEIISDPAYSKEEGILYISNIEAAVENAMGKIDKVITTSNCSSAELHFTTGKCFRYEIYPAYKANRVARRPEGLKEIKLALCEHYNGTMNFLWEADDMVVYLKKKHPEKYTMCAIDKDVLYALPGEHFNYFEANYFRGTTHVLRDMHWVTVSKQDARYWKYMQVVNGDISDNIIGPSRIGPKTMLQYFNGEKPDKAIKIKKLEEALPHMKAGLSDVELWDACIAAYEAKGLTKENAILNMNLINMCLLTEEGKNICVTKWVPDEL